MAKIFIKMALRSFLNATTKIKKKKRLFHVMKEIVLKRTPV